MARAFCHSGSFLKRFSPEGQYNGGGTRRVAGDRSISTLRTQFQELVDRYYEKLWPYVWFLTAGSRDGEDILHQAFLLAFDRLAAGEEFRGDPGAWLRGTLRNLVHAWWREKRKAPQALADQLALLAEEADDALTASAKEEVRAALEHCLAKLAASDRELVAKRYEQGLRITRIAEELEKNVATVRVRLFRIRQVLMLCVQAQLARGSAT